MRAQASTGSSAPAESRLTLGPSTLTKKPRELSLPGLSVNYPVADIPRLLTGSSGADWFIISDGDKITDFKKVEKGGFLTMTV